MLGQWLLDPDVTYLNHGTVGAVPRRVLARQQALRDEMERQPSRFMLRELDGHQPMPWRRVSRLREAIEPVAAFLAARPDDLVFVSSVTTGLNAVLRSVHLAAGDEVVITDMGYDAITLAARAAVEDRGATLRVVALPYPVASPGEMVDAIAAALSARTRLVLVDHVTSGMALILPIADIVGACHRRGVPVLVDGAHAPGAIPLDIRSIGADWYAANLHKWAHAPRSCGVLWADPERQTELHHPVTSWGRGTGYLGEFERLPTYDPTAALAAPEGIALLREWGYERALEYMHGLAWDAAAFLCGRWRTTFDVPRAMVGAMATLPLPLDAGTSDEDAARLRLALLLEDRIEVHVHAWRGRLWIRICTQIYNDTADIERLGHAVARLATAA
jgi:isopenicillin-N epimerase